VSNCPILRAATTSAFRGWGFLILRYPMRVCPDDRWIVSLGDRGFEFSVEVGFSPTLLCLLREDYQGGGWEEQGVRVHHHAHRRGGNSRR
jgi:hypothetical protein